MHPKSQNIISPGSPNSRLSPLYMRPLICSISLTKIGSFSLEDNLKYLIMAMAKTCFTKSLSKRTLQLVVRIVEELCFGLVQYIIIPSGWHISLVAPDRISSFVNNCLRESNDWLNYRGSTPHSLLEWRILTPLMMRMMMVRRLLLLLILLLLLLLPIG